MKLADEALDLDALLLDAYWWRHLAKQRLSETPDALQDLQAILQLAPASSIPEAIAFKVCFKKTVLCCRSQPLSVDDIC